MQLSNLSRRPTVTTAEKGHDCSPCDINDLTVTCKYKQATPIAVMYYILIY